VNYLVHRSRLISARARPIADLLAEVLAAVNEYTATTSAAGESCWDGWTIAALGD
jgi:hypothetical protein